MFGVRGKIGSSKDEVFRTFRLVRSLARRCAGPSSGIYENQDQGPPKSINPQAYIIANQRMHEIETEKAFVTKVSRHDSWKAGGPS